MLELSAFTLNNANIIIIPNQFLFEMYNCIYDSIYL